MDTGEPSKTAANLLGIPNREPAITLEDETLSASTHPSTAPTTAWGIYNQRAAAFDKELIKDWNASLNTLLVFVSIRSPFSILLFLAALISPVNRLFF